MVAREPIGKHPYVRRLWPPAYLVSHCQAPATFPCHRLAVTPSPAQADAGSRSEMVEYICPHDALSTQDPSLIQDEITTAKRPHYCALSHTIM